MIDTTDSTSKKEKNLYEVLGLAPNAKASFVDFSYNSLLVDLSTDPEGNKDAIAELNAAYQILKDPNSRAWYDGELAKQAARAESKEEPKQGLEEKLETDTPNDTEAVIQTKPKNKFVELLKIGSLCSLLIWAAYGGYGYFFGNGMSNLNANSTALQSVTPKGGRTDVETWRRSEAQENLKKQFNQISGDRRIIICTPALTLEQQRDNHLLDSEVLPALAAQDAAVDSDKKDPRSPIYTALKDGHLRVTYQAYNADDLTPVYEMFNNASNLKCAQNYIQYPARNATTAGYETSYKAKDFLSLERRTSDIRRIKAPGETSRFAP